jgi:hypothetical protein
LGNYVLIGSKAGPKSQVLVGVDSGTAGGKHDKAELFYWVIEF